MAGGMFSGHDQCEGDLIERDGKKFKQFYGMSSKTAMEKHAGNVEIKHLKLNSRSLCSKYMQAKCSIFQMKDLMKLRILLRPYVGSSINTLRKFMVRFIR